MSMSCLSNLLAISGRTLWFNSCLLNFSSSCSVNCSIQVYSAFISIALVSSYTSLISALVESAVSISDRLTFRWRAFATLCLFAFVYRASSISVTLGFSANWRVMVSISLMLEQFSIRLISSRYMSSIRLLRVRMSVSTSRKSSLASSMFLTSSVLGRELMSLWTSLRLTFSSNWLCISMYVFLDSTKVWTSVRSETFALVLITELNS